MSSDERIRSVAVFFAMEAEAAPLVKALNLTADDPRRIPGPAPCVSYSGKLGDLNIHLVWNGRDVTHGVDHVGTVAAALTSYVALQAFNPDLVISAGTAGGFKAQGAAIGDVFVSSGKIFHDRRIQLPGFDKYGIGRADSIPTQQLQQHLGLKTGLVSSGNSLDYTDQCMAIMVEHGAAVKEMEAAAIAWVCSLFDKPMFCIKAITDIVDGDRPTPVEFLENLGTAATALQRMLPKVLDFVTNKLPTEL